MTGSKEEEADEMEGEDDEEDDYSNE